MAESVIENFIAEVEEILKLLEVDPEIFRLWEKEIMVRMAPMNKHTSLFTSMIKMEYLSSYFGTTKGIQTA